MEEKLMTLKEFAREKKTTEKKARALLKSQGIYAVRMCGIAYVNKQESLEAWDDFFTES